MSCVVVVFDLFCDSRSNLTTTFLAAGFVGVVVAGALGAVVGEQAAEVRTLTCVTDQGSITDSIGEVQRLAARLQELEAAAAPAPSWHDSFYPGLEADQQEWCPGHRANVARHRVTCRIYGRGTLGATVRI